MAIVQHTRSIPASPVYKRAAFRSSASLSLRAAPTSTVGTTTSTTTVTSTDQGAYNDGAISGNMQAMLQPAGGVSEIRNC